MKVVQINTTANSGSHGRIAEEIGRLLLEKGHKSYIAYGRTANYSDSQLIKIGGKTDLAMHLIKTRLFDNHGFGSKNPTKKLMNEIERLNPDIIHLHNLHGYYLNIQLLFEYLKYSERPVIWTLHDCWSFTGHCAHFEAVNCWKWKDFCNKCPLKNVYPASWIFDNSKKNFTRKKDLLIGLKNMTLVSPSQWLAKHLKNSFLSTYDIKIINNGVDLEKFKPRDSQEIRNTYNLNDNYVVGVASIWTERKGLKDFIKLRKIVDPQIDIVLVGLTKKQIKSLPHTVKAISRTESTSELASIYSGASAFINPTYIDNFPSVNIEALACGTPVITYNTGGSPESITPQTGVVVDKEDIPGLNNSIRKIMQSDDLYSKEYCRNLAVSKYSAGERFGDYLALYEEVI